MPMGFEPHVLNHGKAVYIIKAYALYITNGLPLYIIIAKSDTACH